MTGSDDEALRRAYRDTIGRLATGVTIVTAAGSGGPAGMTTNAVTSVSLQPLLLLVCFDHTSRTLDVVRESRRFALNILGVGHEELAAVFASKAAAIEKFEAVIGHLPDLRWSTSDGVPVLDSALAWIVCDLTELREAGDHTIGIGAVIAMSAGAERDPLIWYGGRYTTIAKP